MAFPSLSALRQGSRTGSAQSAERVTWLGGRHLKRRVVRLAIHLVGDIAALVVFGLLVQALRASELLPLRAAGVLDRVLPSEVLSRAEFPLAVIICLAIVGAYGEAERTQVSHRRAAGAALGLALNDWPMLWGEDTGLVLATYSALAVSVTLLLVAVRRLADDGFRSFTSRRFRVARVLMVAGRHDLGRMQRPLSTSEHGRVMIAGVLDPGELHESGGLERLCEAIRGCDADTVALCCGALEDAAFNVVVDAATTMGCGLVSWARSFRGAGSTPRLVETRRGTLMILASPAARALGLVMKRSVDVVGAGLLVLVLAPVMAVVAFAVRFDSPGPILFRQRRVGVGGQPFPCFKFRSMRVEAEELLRSDPLLRSRYEANNFKIPEGSDPRITRLGHFLRRTSLDELPQLLNVLRGEMSLVGPRPVVPEELVQYGETHTVLLSLKPGMAGAWAVNGRSRVGYPRRAAIELGYVRSWRLKLDLSILWRTLPAVITRRGAH
jgi:exopolysaccharide production protein ExoY